MKERESKRARAYYVLSNILLLFIIILLLLQYWLASIYFLYSCSYYLFLFFDKFVILAKFRVAYDFPTRTACFKLTKMHSDTLALTCAWFIKFRFLSLCYDVYATTLLYTFIQLNILCPLHRLLHGEHQGTKTSKTELRAPAFLSIRHKSVRCHFRV